MDNKNEKSRKDDGYIKAIADKTIQSLDTLDKVEDFDEFQKLLNENLESIIHPPIDNNDANPSGFRNGLFDLSPLPEPPHIYFQTYNNAKQNILRNLTEFENGYFNYDSDIRNNEKSNSSTPIPIEYNNIQEESRINQHPPQPPQNQYIPSPPQPKQQPQQNQYIPPPPPPQPPQNQYIPQKQQPPQQNQYIPSPQSKPPQQYIPSAQPKQPPQQQQYIPSPIPPQQQSHYISSPSPSLPSHYYPSPQNIQSYKYPPSTISTQTTPKMIYPSNRNDYENHRNITLETPLYKKDENINTHYHYYIPPPHQTLSSLHDKPTYHHHHHHNHQHQRNDENEYYKPFRYNRDRSNSPSTSPSPPPPKYFSSSTREEYNHYNYPHYESIKHDDYNIYKSYPQRCNNPYPLKSRPLQSNYLQNKYNCMKSKSNFVSPDFVLDLSCQS